MEYLGKLVTKYKKKKYSVFRDRTGLYYLNGEETHIFSSKDYYKFIDDEQLQLIVEA